jgi:RNA polymerase sigma-70 factor (ECF subfamily)
MPYKEKTLPDVRASYSKFVLSKNAGSSNYIDYSKLPDKSLWEAFKSGDEFAFINIYKEYSNKLYNYGCQFCEDKEMVKDCLQDFFIYLRKNRLGFAETNSIKMYLFKAFKRRVVDYLNKNTSEFRLSKMFALLNFLPNCHVSVFILISKRKKNS